MGRNPQIIMSRLARAEFLLTRAHSELNDLCETARECGSELEEVEALVKQMREFLGVEWQPVQANELESVPEGVENQ